MLQEFIMFKNSERNELAILESADDLESVLKYNKVCENAL